MRLLIVPSGTPSRSDSRLDGVLPEGGLVRLCGAPAGDESAHEHGFAAERASQVEWLRERLGLDAQ